MLFNGGGDGDVAGTGQVGSIGKQGFEFLRFKQFFHGKELHACSDQGAHQRVESVVVERNVAIGAVLASDLGQ